MSEAQNGYCILNYSSGYYTFIPWAQLRSKSTPTWGRHFKKEETYEEKGLA